MASIIFSHFYIAAVLYLVSSCDFVVVILTPTHCV